MVTCYRPWSKRLLNKKFDLSPTKVIVSEHKKAPDHVPRVTPEVIGPPFVEKKTLEVGRGSRSCRVVVERRKELNTYSCVRSYVYSGPFLVSRVKRVTPGGRVEKDDDEEGLLSLTVGAHGKHGSGNF